jgi:ABC-type iron transport system FetAB ATPase subunit
MGPSGCGKSTLLNIVGLLDAWRLYLEPGMGWFKERTFSVEKIGHFSEF